MAADYDLLLKIAKSKRKAMRGNANGKGSKSKL